TGQVKDATTAQDVERVASAFLAGYAPAGGSPPVVNLIQVLGTQQVQLEVRFAEVSRTALRQMGVHLWAHGGSDARELAGGVLGPDAGLNSALAPDLGNAEANAQLQVSGGVRILTSPIAGAVALVFASSAKSDVPLSAALSLLSSRGFAKTLAEPTLVAL